MTHTIASQLISLHGGHSGQFCCHAKDSLEDIVLAYIQKGFKAVGITEHMPPRTARFLYPDEKAQGLTVQDLAHRFGQYFDELERLKRKYQDQIRIYKGFETETYSGWQDQVAGLLAQFSPDYVVGSVHHVQDVCFDYSRKDYQDLIKAVGGIEALYSLYFDAQYEMITTLQPFVVGHFDLIRIYDPAYETHMALPRIQEKIQRNLLKIKALGLVLDYNLRPLYRGDARAYLTPQIFNQAKILGIPVIPGDDSHSSDQAGQFTARAVQDLETLGFSTQWPVPWCRPMTEPGSSPDIKG